MNTPSKYLGLDFLTQAKNNYYRSPNGKEYCPEETDLLINEKIETTSDQFDMDAMAEWLEMEASGEVFLGVMMQFRSLGDLLT